MVHLLKMVIFHGYVGHSQMVMGKHRQTCWMFTMFDETRCYLWLWGLVKPAMSGGFPLMDCSISVSRSYMVATRQLHIGHETPLWSSLATNIPISGVSGGALWMWGWRSSMVFHVPSGKRLHNYGKSSFFMGKSTISMAMFNSFLYVYQRVNSRTFLRQVLCKHINHKPTLFVALSTFLMWTVKAFCTHHGPTGHCIVLSDEDRKTFLDEFWILDDIIRSSRTFLGSGTAVWFGGDLYLLRQWPWIHRAYYTTLYLLDPFGYWPFDLCPLLSGRAPTLQPRVAALSRQAASSLQLSLQLKFYGQCHLCDHFQLGELSHPVMIRSYCHGFFRYTLRLWLT
jgi:hypothetical protein